jgi:S-DNA-T family DNA segregation ATPase FtsK/SpoIIIE
LILGIRVDERGQLIPVTISLYELFHTLVAASSGWGKSVFANSLLSQLATCPQPVELVLIDQQDHGLAAFRQCDRLRYPLLRQPEEILGALQEVHEEAVRYRSELFARYDADDLAEYNRRADQFLPPIVVAVDEASALLAYKEIGAELKRHAWELRKFGVYQILLLTSAKGVVIDTDHRQQFASKVQLHANERTQARLLLDAPEATTFPPGRAVVELPGLPPTIIQTPYIDKREVRALLRPAGSPPPPPASVAEPTPAELAEQEKDRLFKQRVEAGLSRNAASLEAYGRRYAGDLVERGKRILGER